MMKRKKKSQSKSTFMVDKKIKTRYNDVKVVFESDRTIFKLYREGKLIYIGVKQNESVPGRPSGG
jgi:hypothetical protein